MNEEERNSIEKVENLIKRCDECKLKECINCETNYTEITSIKRIVDSYKRVLKETEELKKDYYNVINKIENKIDRFDYEFEKAKRQNNKDKSDYYWNLIINFKELLESEG